jgi:hypothetical protein
MEIVLITDYSNTKDKKQHLRKLIKDVKQHFDVCLNSHCVLPDYITESVDYYIQDIKNSFLIDNRYKGIKYFDYNNFRVIFKDYRLPASHLPAIIRQILPSLNYLKSFGYDIVHLLEYDSDFISPNLFNSNSKILTQYDCVIYRDAHRFISNTYSINLNNFSSQDLIYNEETVNNLYKKNYTESIAYAIEVTMEELIFNNKNKKELSIESLNDNLIIGKEDFDTETFFSKIDFTFLKIDGVKKYFIRNGNDFEIVVNLVINDNLIITKNISQGVWLLFDLPLENEIITSKCFINNLLYFDLDFTKEENLTLIEDAKIIIK